MDRSQSFACCGKILMEQCIAMALIFIGFILGGVTIMATILQHESCVEKVVFDISSPKVVFPMASGQVRLLWSKYRQHFVGQSA